MILRWLLVRHGATEWWREGRYAGHTDVALAEHGRELARRLAKRLTLERYEFDACYTSDLRRATETLDLLLAACPERPPVHICPELREVHFGEWEGRTYAEIAALPRAERMLAGDEAAPGGESLAHLCARVEGFVDRLQRTDWSREGPTVLIVSHGGPLRVLVCRMLGLPAKDHWRFDVEHASLTELTWEPRSGARLVRLNDRCHH